jgi:hypothetical protein
MRTENKKIAKGYRLRPETHEIIREAKQAARGDIDFAISAACRKFLQEIKSNNNRAERILK